MYVQDIARTAEFYQALGFRMGERTETSCKVYLNWFWMQFTAIEAEDKAEFQKEAQADPKGGGLYINVAVEDIDALYADVVSRGWRPSSEPRDWPSGTREFVLRDPDGYKLVFFEKR
jgi:catechol 2,3-dioxygenase-like lactoylglutathione lyase family enzyme